MGELKFKIYELRIILIKINQKIVDQFKKQSLRIHLKEKG